MIYDITQPLLTCNVYPGDDSPKLISVSDINRGDLYNLSNLSMCVHNGTHVDAPKHFYKDGKGIGEICLDKFIGKCAVVYFEGEMNKEDAAVLLEKTKGIKKLLVKGNAIITLEAAQVFSSELELIGTESQSVGPIDAPMAVHLELLKNEVVLLEGIVLKDIKEGIYFLNCAPINLGDCDGAPCRAILMDI